MPSVIAPPGAPHTQFSPPPIKSFSLSSPAKSTNINSLDSKPLTVDELMRLRCQLTPDQAIVSYPSSGINYVDYTPRQLDVFAYRAAEQYALRIPQRKSSDEKPLVIGLLGPSNLDYLITFLALSKLGHTVLFLSTRISKEAYLSLLNATDSRNLVIHSSFRDMATKLQGDLPSLRVDELVGEQAYHYALGSAGIDTRMSQDFNLETESKHIAWIIHSSGSTGLPKPILQTHKAAVNNYATNMDMRGFITLPLYHAHGLSSFFRAISSGKQIHLYNASLPLAKQHIIEIMRNNRFEIFYGVPYALKLLAESTEGIELLASCKIVMFGGSSCPDSLGDKLVENGVNLVSHFGTTETGQLMTSFRPDGDKAWDYVRPSAALKPFLRFEERGEDLFELICLDGWPSKVTSNRPDGSYATKDLFKKHPTLEAYKYFARLDDTIVLVNGEKAVPLAFEGRVREHEMVAEAVLFGAGQPSLGLILIPSQIAAHISREELLDAIWPLVDQAQTQMPTYAQISRDMVVILPADTVYPCTDKGTIIRQAFYRKFEQEIAEAYVEKETDGDLSLSEPELRTFIHEELLKIVRLEDSSTLTGETDFFGIGMDSLQSTQLRSTLVKRINTSGNKLGLNIVFDYPTIHKLANKLYSLRVGVEEKTSTVEEEMSRLIAKYGNFKRHMPGEEGPDGRYLVITGATGSLGAHVVANLVVQEDVRKVYCLVRAQSADQAQDRVVRSLCDRKVYNDLHATSRTKIIALPSDFSKADLDLEPSIFEQLTAEMTALIHCAWSVNFNLKLSSFEKDCIAGTHHLIELCLASRRPRPATFSFCSSVSTVVNTKGDIIPEALPAHLSYAQNMGYAQSKLVTENLCQIATEQTGISAHVLRIGQVIGDTDRGIWNATEAIPMMLQSATTINALPRLEEAPRWLPVDVVAKSVIEITSSSAPSGVVNIINPRTFHWTRDLLPYLHAAGLQFAELETRDWVARLRDSNPDPVANPPIKLLQFFTNKYDKEGLPSSTMEWETGKARTWSKTLAEAPVLDQGLVDKMIGHFRRDCW